MRLVRTSKGVAAALLMMVGACGQATSQRVVSSDDYLDLPKCWENGKGEVSAFFILARRDGYDEPYYISSRCVIGGDGTKEVVNFAVFAGTMAILDEKDLMRRALRLDRPLANAASDHRGVPGMNDEVYYLVAKVAPAPSAGSPIYTVTTVRSLTRLPVTFEQLMKMPRDARWKLATGADHDL